MRKFYILVISFALLLLVSCSQNSPNLKRPTRPTLTSGTNDYLTNESSSSTTNSIQEPSTTEVDNRINFPHSNIEVYVSHSDRGANRRRPYHLDIPSVAKKQLNNKLLLTFGGQFTSKNYIEDLLSGSSSIEYIPNFSVSAAYDSRGTVTLTDEQKREILKTFKLLPKSSGDYLYVKTDPTLYDKVPLGVSVTIKCELTIKSDKYKDGKTEFYISYRIKP